MRELLLERYRRWLESLPPQERRRPALFTMDGRIYAPEDVLREMRRGTRMGRVFEEAERKLLRRTLERRRMV